MSDKTLTLSLARLPRALGSTLHEDIVWRAPDDLGTPSMAVAPGTPLDVSVDLTSVEDGVLVQVATSVDLVGECVRCLDEVRDHHDVSGAEVYFEPGAPALTPSDEEDEDADDLFVIGERDTINIETQLRDAIVTLVDPRPPGSRHRITSPRHRIPRMEQWLQGRMPSALLLLQQVRTQ